MRIDNVRLDFKEKALAKVGSLSNTSHMPGGGNVMVKTNERPLTHLPAHTKCLSLQEPD